MATDKGPPSQARHPSLIAAFSAIKRVSDTGQVTSVDRTGVKLVGELPKQADPLAVHRLLAELVENDDLDWDLDSPFHDLNGGAA